MHTVVIAHRTCPRDAPENSLAGVRRAADEGADAVEVDVRRSADGVPFLLHDPLLARTTGWPAPVRGLPASLVGRARLRRGGGERVPRLEAVLTSLPPTLRVAVDVKDPGAMGAVVEIASAVGRLSQLLLWSQHAGAVRDAVRLAPDNEVAFLQDTSTPEETRRYLTDTAALGADAVSLHERAATADAVAAAHAAGLRVYCWIQSVAGLDSAIGLGLDGIITDWPAAARAALGR